MNFVIASYLKAPSVLAGWDDIKEWDTIAVVTANQTISPCITRPSKGLLLLNFDDIECPFNNYHMPTECDIAAAIRFTKDRSNLLFTCPSGVSLSPAIAYICRCSQVAPEKAIYTLIPRVHYPNTRIIALGAKILKKEEVFNCYTHWAELPSHRY